MNQNISARIFVSYSHRGNGPAWKAELLRALYVFEQHHLLDVWQDGKIRVSSFWDDDIRVAMSSSRIAVILLTKQSLESEYILNEEFPFLKERRQRDSMPVFPVICEPCDWKAHEWLRAIQAPNESNPLSQLTEAVQDRVFRQLATDIAKELSGIVLDNSPMPDRAPRTERIYLDRFPLTHGPGLREEKLIGREQELALLDLAFGQTHTAIVSLVAWGGVGKTMLVQHWLKRLQREGWFGARRVYAWSFYSQGTKEDRQASEDTFLAHALEWFGVQCEPTLSPWDKGRLLADAVARERTLLILDGIEPLQYPPGPMGGQLRAPGVQSLLKQLARKSSALNSQPSTLNQALCLVTTREPLTDLADFQRREGTPWGSVIRVDLGNLAEEAGAALLHHAGANRAGAAEIKPDDKELLAASREVDGHALTLNLLGRFLARAHGGDIRRRDLVKFEEADRKEQGGTTFKILAAFENWFAKGGDTEARSLAVLRMLGLFDRPADDGCLAALRRSPVIAGITDQLFHSRSGFLGWLKPRTPLPEETWNSTVSYVVEFGLVQADAGKNERLLDCHPLIRQYFGERLLDLRPRSFNAAHSRICDFLLDATDRTPASLERLVPLYQAISHGCYAQRYHEMAKVYLDRINRGTRDGGFYSTRQLGAFGSDLEAVAAFFIEPWTIIAPQFGRTDQGWLTYAAGFLLRSIGRLDEAIEPMRLGAVLAVQASDWANAAIRISNFSQALQLSGRMEEAVDAAEDAVFFARRSNMADQVTYRLAAAGDSHYQLGDVQTAKTKFEEAEMIQAEYGGFPYLGSHQGQTYCELLLREAERATWARLLYGANETDEVRTAAQVCMNVLERAQATLQYDREGGMGVLSLALSLLSICRATVYRETLVPDASVDKQASVAKVVASAYRGLEEANVMEFLPLILMSRAMFYSSRKDPKTAASDLDEAWDIAERGPMRLHLADIHLYRARLFFREKPYPWNSPQDDLAAADKLIHDCGYHRRDEELVDAKCAILGT